MRAVKSLRFIVSTLLLALVAFPFVVHAQDAIAERAQLITQRCSELQTSIDQLQRRDLVSRTNLGREFETVARELDAFNQRLANNNLDNKPFVQLLSQFNDAANQFRDAYVHYDDSVNKLLAINCQKDPGGFDAQLGTTRGLREATDGTASRATGFIGQYRTLAAQLQLPIQAAQNGSSSQ